MTERTTTDPLVAEIENLKRLDRENQAEIGRLRAILRVNLLRNVQGVTHADIDEMLAQTPREEREPFDRVHKEAYGWLWDNDGYLAGLTQGDQGYEQTDLKFFDLLNEALTAEEKRNGPKIESGEITEGDWVVLKAWHDLIDTLVEGRKQ